MNTLSLPQITLRSSLALAGALTVFVGIDNALGGIATLGLQGPTDFIGVTNLDAFKVRDSHVRFLGAVWLGVGLIFLAGSVWLDRLRLVIATLCGLAMLGGVARFSSMGLAEMFDAGLAAPLIAELVVFPLIGLFALRSADQPARLVGYSTV
jgi:hypothetical protein